jgi:tRNA(adenine34) deaminase
MLSVQDNMFSVQDKEWMEHALLLAKQSEEAGEVPVGAVLTFENTLIGKGQNRSIQTVDPTAHAEIIALRQGAVYLNNYRLLKTTLYVTLEPCVMCFGALIHARVGRVVYGASDPKTGALHSAFQLSEDKRWNHRVQCEGGLLEGPCGQMLTEFFQKKRFFRSKKV